MTKPIRDYEGLRAAIDERRKDLGITMEELNFQAEICDGYYNKLICGDRHFGPKSLPAVLGALGVELILQPRRD